MKKHARYNEGIIVKKIFTLLFLCVFFSCNEKNSNDLSLDLAISEEVAFEDNFVKKEIRFKSKDFFILGIDKVVFFEGKYFLHDGFMSNSLYVADEGGNILGQIGSEGEGPGEYFEATDFFIDDESATINIYDASTGDLISYDLDGQYIGRRNLGYYADKVMMHDEKEIIYLGFLNNDNEDHRMIVRSGDQLTRQFTTKRPIQLDQIINSPSVFAKSASELYFIEYMSAKIFKFQGDHFEPMHQLYLGDQAIDEIDYDTLRFKASVYYKAIKSGQKPTLNSYTAIGEELLFSVTHDGETALYQVNPNNDQKVKLTGTPIKYMLGADQNSFYAFASADMEETAALLPEPLTEDDGVVLLVYTRKK